MRPRKYLVFPFGMPGLAWRLNSPPVRREVNALAPTPTPGGQLTLPLTSILLDATSPHVFSLERKSESSGQPESWSFRAFTSRETDCWAPGAHLF